MAEQQSEYIEAEEVVQGTAELQVYQQDKAMFDVQIMTAKRFPRNLQKCINNAITIVTLDMETARSCAYTINKGGKNITGPSVHLARIVARAMGNIRLENKVVGFDDTHVTCQATCFDLENNYAVRTTIKRSISGKNGRFSEDMCVIIGNAGNAVAFRNAVIAVAEPSIMKKVYDAAMDMAIGKPKDENALIARRTNIVEGLKNTYPHLNLTDEEIARSVGRSSISHLKKEDIFTLIGFETAIRDGDKTVEEIFRPIVNNNVEKPKREDKQEQRVLTLIEAAATKSALEKIKSSCITTEQMKAYDTKMHIFNT